MTKQMSKTANTHSDLGKVEVQVGLEGGAATDRLQQPTTGRQRGASAASVGGEMGG